MDGVSQGVSAPATDLHHQAMTRGKKVLDGIRKGKAVFKATSAATGMVLMNRGARENDTGLMIAGAGALLASALTNPTADVRYWTLLPAEIHFLPLRLAPGMHEVEVIALRRQPPPATGWHAAVPRGGRGRAGPPLVAPFAARKQDLRALRPADRYPPRGKPIMTARSITILTVVVLLVSLGCSRRNRPTREGSFPEAVSPVTVHTKINGRVKMTTFTTGHTPDGRLTVKVVLQSSSTKPMTVIAYADWLDRNRNIVERGNDTPLVIPSGGTVMFEDAAYSHEVETFSVAVRPAHTKRKDY